MTELVIVIIFLALMIETFGLGLAYIYGYSKGKKRQKTDSFNEIQSIMSELEQTRRQKKRLDLIEGGLAIVRDWIFYLDWVHEELVYLNEFTKKDGKKWIQINYCDSNLEELYPEKKILMDKGTHQLKILMEMLIDAGVIVAKHHLSNEDGPTGWLVSSITPWGHEFINLARDEHQWEIVKERVLNQIWDIGRLDRIKEILGTLSK